MKRLACKMDWNLGENRKYLLAFVGFCGMIPHAILCLLRLDAISASLSPFQMENYTNFFVGQWIPFWAALISYLRLQKRDVFSLFPGILTALLLLTLLPVYEHRSVAAMALTIPLIVLLELSAFLKQSEIAADRALIRAFFFWSVAFLCVVHISCEASTWDAKTVVSPFQLLPIPGVLLFDVFKRQEKKAPTRHCIAAMLLMIPVSMCLAAVGPMAQFRFYHWMNLGFGYAILFVLLIVYNLDQWKKNSQ